MGLALEIVMGEGERSCGAAETAASRRVRQTKTFRTREDYRVFFVVVIFTATNLHTAVLSVPDGLMLTCSYLLVLYQVLSKGPNTQQDTRKVERQVSGYINLTGI